MIQWKNAEGKWQSSEGLGGFNNWQELLTRGWKFCHTTGLHSVMMEMHGIFQEWREVNEKI